MKIDLAYLEKMLLHDRDMESSRHSPATFNRRSPIWSNANWKGDSIYVRENVRSGEILDFI